MKLSEEEKSQLGQLLTMLLGLIVPVLLAYLSEYIYSPKPFIRAKVENYKYYSVSSPCVAAYLGVLKSGKMYRYRIIKFSLKRVENNYYLICDAQVPAKNTYWKELLHDNLRNTEESKNGLWRYFNDRTLSPPMQIFFKSGKNIVLYPISKTGYFQYFPHTINVRYPLNEESIEALISEEIVRIIIDKTCNVDKDVRPKVKNELKKRLELLGYDVSK